LTTVEYSGKNLSVGCSVGFEVSMEDQMGHVVGHIFFRMVENTERISTIEEFGKRVLPAEIKGKSWSVN
jgi:hypothetical protein